MTSKEALELIYAYSDDDVYHNIEKEVKIIEKDLNKLAKVKRWVNRKIDYLENGVFLVPQGQVAGAIKILKELKEVLNDE